MSLNTAGLTIRLNCDDLANCGSQSELRRALRITVHPDYDMNTSDNDVAVIELDVASQIEPVGIISSNTSAYVARLVRRRRED